MNHHKCQELFSSASSRCVLCVFFDFQNFPKLYVKRSPARSATACLLTAPLCYALTFLNSFNFLLACLLISLAIAQRMRAALLSTRRTFPTLTITVISPSLTKINCRLIQLKHSFSFQTTAKHNASNYFLLDAL